eukprot:gene7944-12411_t
MTEELKTEIFNLQPQLRLKRCFELSSKYKKEEFESLIKELEATKDQDNINFSLHFAIAIKDQERVLSGLKSASKSQQTFALMGLSILDDQNLKNAILTSVPSVRRKILKKIRLNRLPVVESVALELSKKVSKGEMMTLLPFLKDEKITSTILKDVKNTDPSNLLTNTFLRRKPKKSMEIYKEHLIEKKKRGNQPNIEIIPSKKMVKISPKEFFDLFMELNGNFGTWNSGVLDAFASDKEIFMKFLDSPQYKRSRIYFRKSLFKKLKASNEEMFNIFMKVKEVSGTNFSYSFLTPFSSINKKSFEKYIKYISEKVDLTKELEGHYIQNFPAFIQSKITEHQLEVLQSRKNKQLTELMKVQNYYNKMDISKVRKEIEAICSESNSNNRMVGYSSLIQSTISSEKEYLETLKYLIKKIKNEADPVKETVLLQLTNMTRSKGFLDYPEELGQLFLPMFTAADRSTSTQSSIVKIASHAFYYHKESEKHQKFFFEVLKIALKSEPYLRNSIVIKEPKVKEIELFWKELKEICIEELEEGKFELVNIFFTQFSNLYKEKVFKEIGMTAISYLPKIPSHLYSREILNFISLMLKDKKTKPQVIKKLLEMDSSAIAIKNIQKYIFSSSCELLIPYIEKAELISTKNLTKGSRFIHANSYFKFDKYFIFQYAHIMKKDVREKFEKFLITQYDSEKFKSGEKRSFIFSLAKLQIGPYSENFKALSKKSSELEDQKLKQAFENSALYVDIPDIKSQISEINAKNAKSICGSLNSLIQFLPQEFSQNFIIKFISDESFLKKPTVVQKEIISLLTNFPNTKTTKILQDLWKNEKLIEGVKTVIANMTPQFLDISESLWNILEDASKSSVQSIVAAVFQPKYKWSLNEEMKTKMAKLQLKAFESSSLDIKSHAWNYVWNDSGIHKEVSEICVKQLEDYSKTSQIYSYRGIITQKLINCAHYDEKVLDSVTDLMTRLLTDKKFKEIDEQNNCNKFNDLPVRATIQSIVQSISSDVTFFTKHGKTSFVHEIAELIVKYDETLYHQSFLLVVITIDSNPMKIINQLISISKSMKEIPFDYACKKAANIMGNRTRSNIDMHKLVEELFELSDKEEYCHFICQLFNRTDYQKRRENPIFVEGLKKLRKHKNGIIREKAMNISF